MHSIVQLTASIVVLQDAVLDGPDMVAEGDGSNEGVDNASAGQDGRKPLLKKYIGSFDRTTLLEMHRIMSIEGRGLVDRQIVALWGDAKDLQQEMQTVVYWTRATQTLFIMACVIMFDQAYAKCQW